MKYKAALVTSANLKMENHKVIAEPTAPETYVIGSTNKNEKNVDSDKIISVIGSGDYGRAISGRLVKSGYTVFIGSRDPSRGNVKTLVRQTGANLVDQETAIASANVIIVAISRDNYERLPLSSLQHKLLIDVSNNTKQRKGPQQISNAEYLQNLIPEASVVKSFNVVSAYSLQNGGMQGSKEVLMASDDNNAKTIVSAIIRAMGYSPIDWGALRAARDIEDVPLRLMPSWRRPMAVVFTLFAIFYALNVLVFQICPNIESGKWTENWGHLSLVNLNRTLAQTAIWTLSLCYLPGLLAAYIQLYRGTKYSLFPKWLDNWLKMRKQLGLLMFLLACLHVAMSMPIFNPKAGELNHEPAQTILATVLGDNNSTSIRTVIVRDFDLNWKGELFVTLGAFTLCLTGILAITSIPSIAASLSWREFTFIQTKLGWLSLIAASCHCIFLVSNFLFARQIMGCFTYLPPGPQYALYGSFICVLLKLPLLLPPVDKYLLKIRKGYERPSSKEKANKQVTA